MGYICLKPMKVQVAPGVIEMRKPGDPVPEAENWPNPAIWEKRGFIKLDDGKPTPGYDRSKLVDMKPADSAAVVRSQPVSAPVPKAGEPIEGYTGQGNVEPTVSRDDLMALTRDQLNELAAQEGVEDADSMPNKGAVADAILEAHKAS